MAEVEEAAENEELNFPLHENKGGKGFELPSYRQAYQVLFSVFKGDIQKMDWFYKNKTKADLMLMVYMHNYTKGYYELTEAGS